MRRKEMKKKIIIRGLLGLPIGIAVGFIFSLIISIFIGNDVFYPVSPTLIKTVGNELDAVILQTSLCSLIGIGFSAASVIWEIDTWSLAKQSGIYFLIISIIMFPSAYFANWMEHTLVGFLSYAGIFIAIFFVVWISIYLSCKHKINKMNTAINNRVN